VGYGSIGQLQVRYFTSVPKKKKLLYFEQEKYMYINIYIKKLISIHTVLKKK